MECIVDQNNPVQIVVIWMNALKLMRTKWIYLLIAKFFAETGGHVSYFLLGPAVFARNKKTLLILSNLNDPIVMGLKTKNQ